MGRRPAKRRQPETQDEAPETESGATEAPQPETRKEEPCEVRYFVADGMAFSIGGTVVDSRKGRVFPSEVVGGTERLEQLFRAGYVRKQ